MSFAEKLALLSNPEPVFEDPENCQDETSAKVSEYEPDDSEYISVGNQPSQLRIRNADLGNGVRYKGKKVSREAISKERGNVSDPEDGEDVREHAAAELGHMFEMDDDSYGSQEESNEEDEEDEDDEDGEDAWEVEKSEEDEQGREKTKFTFDADVDDFSQFGAVDSEDSDGSESEDDDDNDDDDEDDGEENVVNGTENAAEVEKGIAVQQQLKVWDKILETRIQEQKIIGKVNRLPRGDYWHQLVASDEGVQENVKEAQKSLKMLLMDLLTLEQLLMKKEEPPQKRKKLSEFSQQLEENCSSYKATRNQVIQKWGDKTRITSGKNNFSAFETSTVAQIEQIMRNSDRLVERTKLKRSAYHIMGETEDAQNDGGANKVDPEIFDDDDFYHQLLRDLIDRKTNNSSDQLQVTRQWLEVQKLRTKLKKKVDTKASKGRKVRYDIHAKLVNFMAPVYGRADKEEMKNELFASLFGARK